MISGWHTEMNNFRPCRALLLLSGLIFLLLQANPVADTVEVFRLEHTSLGQAILTAGPSELTVSDIGLSGADGVSTFLPGEPEIWGMKLFEPLAVGASMVITSYGVVEGVPDQMAGTFQMSNSGAEGLLMFDFSSVEADAITIDYINEGHRVLRENYTAVNSISITIQNGGANNIDLPGWLKWLLGIPDDVCISLGWEDIPGGVTVLTPIGSLVQVTDIRVVAENVSLPPENLSRIDITANGLTAFTMINEWTELSRCALCLPGDLNRDRYVNLQDVVLMAENWLVCTAPAEPECTWMAQESAESFDRSLSAIISELEQVYTPGMTRQEFFDEAIPDDGGEIGMPDALHKALDAIYDLLKIILS